MRARALLGLVAAAVVAAAAGPDARAQDAPFPAGTSSQELEGLRCSIVMPAEFDPAKERSMVVILHGAGGTETGMAAALTFLAERDFVVLAPKSRGQVWEAQDLAAVRRIVADLVPRLRIGAGRLHAAGFSNGGWNLAEVAFDPEQRYASACWIAAGFKGGKLPKHAKKGMGALALAGAEDANRDAAEQTPKLLEDKVRSAEVRIQPGLGHAWPDELMPYYGWWLGLQEGRFVPGETLAFAWRASREEGLAALGAEDGPGGLEFWYSAADASSDAARALQNEAFQDPLVRFLGGQLVAWKQAREDAEETFAELGLAETPAVVVYGADGKPQKTLSGEVSAKALAAALRAVAPEKKPPK